MDAFSLLETTAEVSVAFAGFIGIFLVLAARDGKFPRGDAFQIRLIVLCSVAPVFLSVVPLLLHLLGFAGAMLWRSSSAFVAVCFGALAVYVGRQLAAMPTGEGRSFNYGTVLGIVAIATCALNVVGWPWAPGGGVFLVTLWSVIGIAGGNFIELLFRKVL
jgi:hypothetical protein